MEPFDLKALAQFQNRNEDSIVDQVVIDSRRIASKNAIFCALKGENNDGHEFVLQALEHGAKYAIVRDDWNIQTPTIEKKLIRTKSPLSLLQEIATLHRKKMKASVLAITGSFGKTMLKDLLFSILSKNKNTYASPESFNSQIGVALSLLQITPQHELAIIEAGISEIGEMERLSSIIQPDHVIVTNFCKKRQNLISEKLKLLSKKSPTSWNLVPFNENTKCLESTYKLLFWDLEDQDAPSVECKKKEKNKSTFSIQFANNAHDVEILCDTNYVQDLLQIAVQASHLFKVPEHLIVNALEHYIPEPMRIEVYKSQDGVIFLNDTYAQDPISIDLALKLFDTLGEASKTTKGKKLFVFDGLRFQKNPSKKELERISQSVKKHQVDQVIFSNKEIYDTFKEHINPSDCTLSFFNSFKDAIQNIKRTASFQDTVLIKGEKKHRIDDLIELIEEAPLNNLIVINLAAIQSNIKAVRQHLEKNTRICVMVKALAYGTDDVRIARFLQSCNIDILGVSYVDEGVSLKKQGISSSIFVLNITLEEVFKAVSWMLEIGVHDSMTIARIQHEAEIQNKKIKVHLHLDTGMGRFGCRMEELLTLAEQISTSPNLIFEGFMTHLACADDPEKDHISKKQIDLFQNAIQKLNAHKFFPKWKHILNSLGSIRFSIPESNMVRIGLCVYGLLPAGIVHTSMNFEPAVSLFSKIVGINDCRQHDTIGYGSTHVIQKENARIAVLPIGYYDGLHRNYAQKGFVMIRGKRAPIVGNICMDYSMVDISLIPDAKIGDEVLLFGEDERGNYISPSELAKLGGSIVHELMTCLGPRIRRIFIYDESLRPR